MSRVPLVYRIGKPNIRLKVVTVCLKDHNDWEGFIDVLERQPYWNTYRWRSIDSLTLLNAEGEHSFTSEQAVKATARELIKKAKREYALILEYRESK